MNLAEDNGVIGILSIFFYRGESITRTGNTYLIADCNAHHSFLFLFLFFVFLDFDCDFHLGHFGGDKIRDPQCGL